MFCEHFTKEDEEDDFCNKMFAPILCRDEKCCRNCSDKDCNHKCDYSEGEGMENFVEDGADRDTDLEAKTEVDIKIAEMRQRDAEEVSEKQAIAEMYRMMGRIEAGEFYRKFIDVSTLHFYEQVKEQKLYKKIPQIGTWKDFCKLIGTSFQHVDENLENLKKLGPEFYETANQLGIGYRNLRKLRKLPEGDRQQLLEELEKKELKKEEFIELLEQSFEEKTRIKSEKDELERRFEKKEEKHAKDLVEMTVERDYLKKVTGECNTPERYQEMINAVENNIGEAVRIIVSLPNEVIAEDFDLQVKAGAACARMQDLLRNLARKLEEAEEVE